MTVTERIGSEVPEEARLRIEELERLVGQLQQALESRIVIEQAKGVLSERHRLPPAEAFVLLRRSARSRQRNLHQVAEEIVASAYSNGRSLADNDRRRSS